MSKHSDAWKLVGGPALLDQSGDTCTVTPVVKDALGTAFDIEGIWEPDEVDERTGSDGTYEVEEGVLKVMLEGTGAYASPTIGDLIAVPKGGTQYAVESIQELDRIKAWAVLRLVRASQRQFAREGTRERERG